MSKVHSIRGAARGIKIGEKAPLFQNINQNGKNIILKDLFKEKETILLFITTSCPTCKDILKNLNSVKSEFSLNLIIVNVDLVSEDINIREILPNDSHYIRNNDLLRTYFINSVPSTFILNKKGIVIAKGNLPSIEELYEMLEQINKKQSNIPIPISSI